MKDCDWLDSPFMEARKKRRMNDEEARKAIDKARGKERLEESIQQTIERAEDDYWNEQHHD